MFLSSQTVTLPSNSRKGFGSDAASVSCVKRPFFCWSNMFIFDHCVKVWSLFTHRFEASKQCKTGKPDPGRFVIFCSSWSPCFCKWWSSVGLWLSRWSLQRSSVPDEHHDRDVCLLLQRLAGQTEDVAVQRQLHQSVRTTVWDTSTGHSNFLSLVVKSFQDSLEDLLILQKNGRNHVFIQEKHSEYEITSYTCSSGGLQHFSVNSSVKLRLICTKFIHFEINW